MNFTRRKFLQISAFVCVAPVINKINGIASVNVDKCISHLDIYNTGHGKWYEFLNENLGSRILTALNTKPQAITTITLDEIGFLKK